ncbi:MAG: N-acyl-D-amino-acid deacylase family protein [Streptosporangiales bacterium]
MTGLGGSEMLDLVLRNGRVLDGSGNPWFWADVGVRDGVVAAVGDVPEEARETVDVGGAVVCPGFIDGHTHSDLTIFDRSHAEIKLRQGVTTEVVGNCGMTAAPCRREASEPLRAYVEPILGKATTRWCWETVAKYVDALTEAQPAENVATYVGHNTLRVAAMGFDNRVASVDELARMAGMLEEALQAGAIGLSCGLMYAPGRYAPSEELSELSAVLRQHGGLLAAHIRGEGGSLLRSVEEVVRVAEQNNVPLQVSHLKAAGKSNWGKVAQAMQVIEDARDRGVDVTCDVYPYTAGATSLTTLLPPWALEGGIERTLERLRNAESRKRVKAELRHEQAGWDNLVASTGWDSVYISSLGGGSDSGLEGKNLAEISGARGVDPAECMMDMLVEQGGAVSMVFFHAADADVDRVLAWDKSLVASDSLHGQGAKPHPRLYGTFPRVLAKYVRETGSLSLSEAVRKMTSFPARRFKLGKRGTIAPGYAADLVVFDPETVRDEATYADPKRFASGISYVCVNGTTCVDAGHYRESRSGEVIRRVG